MECVVQLLDGCSCMRLLSVGRKLGPGAAFFSDLENRCPNLRRLHLSKALVNAPLPTSVEFLTLSECSVWPAAFRPTRFDVATPALTSPRLRELELYSVKLQRRALAALPASLKRLRLKNTRMPYEAFIGWRDAVLPRLEEIDLSNDTTLTHWELYCITVTWPHISTLKFSGCVNTFECSTLHRFMLENLGQAGRLEVLEADGVMPIGFYNIHHICWNVGDTLRKLSLAGCELIDGDVPVMATEPTSLQSLDISGCRRLSDRCFIMFAGLRATLHYLNVSSTNITDDTLDLLRHCMPHCEIVRYSQA